MNAASIRVRLSFLVTFAEAATPSCNVSSGGNSLPSRYHFMAVRGAGTTPSSDSISPARHDSRRISPSV